MRIAVLDFIIGFWTCIIDSAVASIYIIFFGVNPFLLHPLKCQPSFQVDLEDVLSPYTGDIYLYISLYMYVLFIYT